MKRKQNNGGGFSSYVSVNPRNYSASVAAVCLHGSAAETAGRVTCPTAAVTCPVVTVVHIRRSAAASAAKLLRCKHKAPGLHFTSLAAAARSAESYAQVCAAPKYELAINL
jgi:hypothetical protein